LVRDGARQKPTSMRRCVCLHQDYAHALSVFPTSKWELTRAAKTGGKAAPTVPKRANSRWFA
jgi:hypothetical protein